MDSSTQRHQVTLDLQELGRRPEDREAIEGRLYARIYGELRVLAAAVLRKESPRQTLQPTDLVHEAYLRLVTDEEVTWEGRAHFFGSAARAMRRILVDHARKRLAHKRGGGWHQVTLDDEVASDSRNELDLIAMDDALSRLAALDPRLASVVELRVFAGMKMHEIAAGLGVSERTVDGDWAMAKRWLRNELAGE